MPAPKQWVNGHWVYGGAAQQHIIKKEGQWDAFINGIVETATKNAVQATIAELEDKYRKTDLKRVK
jgi:hypothetical protein